ncbi:BREX system ATP-binding domain-containing protein [Georgenia sp. MJ173]
MLDFVDDAYVRTLATAGAGELGGKVGVAPRLFLRKLVDVMDRVDQFEGFRPRRDYVLTVDAGELSVTETEARNLGAVRLAAGSVDDVELDL